MAPGLDKAQAKPKVGITALSKDVEGFKFLHTPTGVADFDLKRKLNDKVNLGVGFTDTTLRKLRSGAVPGLVLSGDVKATDDTDLGVAHNFGTGSTKLTAAHVTKIADKKTGFKATWVTKSNTFTGEVVSQLTSNKKATVTFDQKQLQTAKLALTDDMFTYEPSYNFLKNQPSLAVSRPLGPGKYKLGWNLKTDDLSLEYIVKEVKFTATKRPGQQVPTVGISLEKAFDI